MVGFIVTQTNKAFYGLIKETKSLPKKEDAALIDLKVYSKKSQRKSRPLLHRWSGWWHAYGVSGLPQM